ncbi:hypothetical protein V9K67_04000 [Paraflavisolibacter sp. H34]|uniref:hypothetical protein n=1 Tax=Huijunlia imazamoxiresistens TaxID=3127457 RepID=UPI003016C435
MKNRGNPCILSGRFFTLSLAPYIPFSNYLIPTTTCPAPGDNFPPQPPPYRKPNTCSPLPLFGYRSPEMVPPQGQANT